MAHKRKPVEVVMTDGAVEGAPRTGNAIAPRRSVSVEEWEEAVVFLAYAVVLNPALTPSFEYAQRKLEIAKSGPRARALKILNEECLRLGCPPVSTAEDAKRLWALLRGPKKR